MYKSILYSSWNQLVRKDFQIYRLGFIGLRKGIPKSSTETPGSGERTLAIIPVWTDSLTHSANPLKWMSISRRKRRFLSGASFNAEVAELADAHGSGPCTRKGVGVRVPSSAPA